MFCVLRDQLSISLEQSLHILHGKEMREAQYVLSRCLSVSFCGVHLSIAVSPDSLAPSFRPPAESAYTSPGSTLLICDTNLF